jgi:HAD domain in Swiss Army Knife RNA repair proteins
VRFVLRLVHRQRLPDALLRRTDPSTLAAGTCVEAKESPPSDKPLLLVDIDGVLSLFGFPAHAPPDGSVHFIEGIPHFLSAGAAEHLLGLVSVFDLVWCSGWEEKADEHLPHLLGLPRGLPHLSFARRGDAGVGTAEAKSLRGHWKLDAIDAYAGTRPVAWIDDCIDDACREWAAARETPTLLVQTSAAQGLTEREAARLKAWAATLAA